jgi:hypothetical protein
MMNEVPWNYNLLFVAAELLHLRIKIMMDLTWAHREIERICILSTIKGYSALETESTEG